MMVSLCYNQNLERLIVTVCEARGLRIPEGFKALDTVCRVVFMKEHKVMKTKRRWCARAAAIPNTTSPSISG
ncbi:synaptotagmin-15 [Caerostris extrusa]|uniref:Synaptotagmin-15 n=1 Tax=Caerostris extrusa TaxID=172846 RepID=A0AAV4RYC8_CAEEX|nr:synaptotagmin-15 [Caerostris extrusa]